jgi:hypothetical protein
MTTGNPKSRSVRPIASMLASPRIQRTSGRVGSHRDHGGTVVPVRSVRAMPAPRGPAVEKAPTSTTPVTPATTRARSRPRPESLRVQPSWRATAAALATAFTPNVTAAVIASEEVSPW